MPLERSVFQRVNNKATLQIGGNTQVFIHKLQAKLTPLMGGIQRQWTTLNVNIPVGNFRSQIIDVEAGWYKLEIRGLDLNNNQIAYDDVQKVGVGEVFVIAGQSNAQGGRLPNPTFATEIYFGANDDRVNGINWSTDNVNETYPLPNIEKIQPITDIAPTGKASWCWALLGDRIAQEWNVPVIFFNAAIGATTASQWSNSANNGTFPYIYLKKTLQYYTKIYGARALLWHQGETDIYDFGVLMPQSCINYTSNLSNLINVSRNDFNPNLSWVISKVSMISGYTSSQLVQCQETIALLPNSNRFLGPYTDPIQPNAADRDGQVHFRGTGFIDLANAWFASINTPNFINNSLPIAATNNLSVVNNQFVFGNSPPPSNCNGIYETISSGEWSDPSIWSCGVVPPNNVEVIVKQNHLITITTNTIFLKNIILNGSIELVNGGNIHFE
jgi:Carbohydrate esterase, sialic acid-specific acetylesterase